MLLQDVLGQLLVHLADAQLGVEEQQHHVGPADRALGPRQAVELDVAGQAALAADPGRVDGDERLAVALEAHVDAVARRARHFADDHALALGQAVDECALAGVAAADGGQLHRRFLRRFQRVGGRKTFKDHAEEPVLAPVLLGADIVDWAEAELVELGGLRLDRRRVALVGDHDDRLVDVPQPDRHRVVEWGDAAAAVHNKEDDVRLLDGDLDLVLDLGREVVAVLDAHAAGVD